MDLDLAREYLGTHHRGVLLTYRSDGRPQLSPIVLGLDGDGRVAISTRETAMKTHNIRRDPRVSLCVLDDAFFGRWIQVDGRAELVARPEAMDGLIAVYRAVAGEHPDWDEFRSAMDRERRVLVRVSLQSAGPDRQG